MPRGVITTINTKELLELENKLLEEKITRYTNLLMEEAFSGDNEKLLQRYTSRAIDKKLHNQQILEAMTKK